VNGENSPSPLPNTLSYVATAPVAAGNRPFWTVMTAMEDGHGGEQRFVELEEFSTA